MKAIIIKEGTPDLEVKEYPEGIRYEDIREVVEGLIELTVVEINGVRYDFYTNEEFLFLNKKPSLVFLRQGELEGLLAGNIFVTKCDAVGESYIGLTDEEIKNILMFFEEEPKMVLSSKDGSGEKFVVNSYGLN